MQEMHVNFLAYFSTHDVLRLVVLWRRDYECWRILFLNITLEYIIDCIVIISRQWCDFSESGSMFAHLCIVYSNVWRVKLHVVGVFSFFLRRICYCYHFELKIAVSIKFCHELIEILLT